MSEEADGDFDSDGRELCPDGNCTGLLENGRCKLCGRAADGSVAPPPPDHAPDGGFEDDSAAGDGGAGFDPERRLCSDGACTGLIGDDDRCKVCGLPAS
jgi:hypothetical protein